MRVPGEKPRRSWDYFFRRSSIVFRRLPRMERGKSARMVVINFAFYALCAFNVPSPSSQEFAETLNLKEGKCVCCSRGFQTVTRKVAAPRVRRGREIKCENETRVSRTCPANRPKRIVRRLRSSRTRSTYLPHSVRNKKRIFSPSCDYNPMVSNGFLKFFYR